MTKWICDGSACQKSLVSFFTCKSPSEVADRILDEGGDGVFGSVMLGCCEGGKNNGDWKCVRRGWDIWFIYLF